MVGTTGLEPVTLSLIHISRVKELGNYYCVITVDHNYAYIPESER